MSWQYKAKQGNVFHEYQKNQANELVYFYAHSLPLLVDLNNINL